MSSSNSSSTLLLVLIFVLGSGGYFFFKYTSDDKPDRVSTTAKPAKPHETTVVAPKTSPPPPKTALALERDLIWQVLTERPESEPEELIQLLGYGLALVLDPASTEDEVRKGVSIISSHDIRAYGGFAELRKALLDPKRDPDFRRLELERYLGITAHRVKLLRSVLRDERRIEAFRKGEYIPLEEEPWPETIPEPPDEALYHRDLVPGNGPQPGGLSPYGGDPLHGIEIGPDGKVQFEPLRLYPPPDSGIRTIPSHEDGFDLPAGPPKEMRHE